MQFEVNIIILRRRVYDIIYFLMVHATGTYCLFRRSGVITVFKFRL